MLGRRRHPRRLTSGVLVAIALVVTGAGYALLVPRPQTASAQPDAGLVEQGRALYAGSCITCHGSNLQGVADRGPSVVGAGDAAVYFQVSTGRMPLARQEAQAERKPPDPQFDPATDVGRQNLAALGAYVEAAGGGPEVPADDDLVGTDVAAGGATFRLNCASCHNLTGRGGSLLSGKYAPNLREATPEQIYTAMLSGPQAMPAFSDRQLTPEEKRDLIAYVQSVRGQQNSPGGLNLGELGPTTEGAVALLVGLVVLVGITAWIGARS